MTTIKLNGSWQNIDTEISSYTNATIQNQDYGKVLVHSGSTPTEDSRGFIIRSGNVQSFTVQPGFYVKGQKNTHIGIKEALI